MKMIHAYVRSAMAGHVLEALLERGCAAVSVVEVRGVSPGLRQEEYSFSISLAQPVEPMVKLEIVGSDAEVGDWVDLIARTASTGTLGDGMVFVTPVETAVRIGTGARGDAALPAPGTRGPDLRA
ncbi:MAG: P-II family nitrogen regulator [Gemmatimonadales bacterium]